MREDLADQVGIAIQSLGLGLIRQRTSTPFEYSYVNDGRFSNPAGV